MFGSFGDINILLFSQDWQSGLILLYLMNAKNSTLPQGYCFLKSIKIDFPVLEMDFTTLWFGVPNNSPISIDFSSGPSYTTILFNQSSI